MGAIRIGLPVLLALAGGPAAAGEPVGGAGALLCRYAKAVRPRLALPDTSAFQTRAHTTLQLHDRFTAVLAGDPAALQLRRTRALCLPAVEGEASVSGATSGLTSIDVRPPRGDSRPRGGSTQLLRGDFGELTVEVKGLVRILTSASVSPGMGDTGPFDRDASDDFTCYRVRPKAKGAGLGKRTFTTADGRWALRVQKPRRMCVPAGSGEQPGGEPTDYLCYRAKARRGLQAPPRGGIVSTTTAYGRELLRVGHATELCFPTERTTVPPDNDVVLTVTPGTPGIEWRETADFRASALLPDGTTEDWTARVEWTSSDEEVAALDESGIAGRFFGRNPGGTTVRASDAATGATATATLTVDWSLERIELQPAQVNRAVGQAETYQANGYFPNGVTHNVTPRLVYASSDSGVANATNAAATPSRVEAMGFGAATISACDPLSGICSTDSGDDAEMIVLGGLQSIQIQPGSRQAVFPGQHASFTAIGHYADGRTKNLTQKVTWTSTDASVLAADNAEPNRGAMRGVSPGGAFLRAIDPKTGVQSVPHQVYVLGDLTGIDLHPFQSRFVRPPGSRRFTAIGMYEGGGRLNLTQDVEWTSETPAVGVAPNEDGDRSRIDTGGAGGLSRIQARDPGTGMVSNDAFLASLGALQSLHVDNHLSNIWSPYNRIAVGQLAYVRTIGSFEFGWINLNRFSPESFQLVSSDPSVAEVVDGSSVRGVAPGMVTLKGIDLASGLESPEAPFIVHGDPVRIELRGADLIRVGGRAQLFAYAHYAEGFITPFVGDLSWVSSDPTVLGDDHVDRRRTTFLGLAPGAATISAIDPHTGLSSTDTGDDFVVTVLPDEPPVEVTIHPPVTRIPVDGFDDLTAVAHFASGQTLNVTQEATWTSSAPDVAAIMATPDHGASHTVGTGAGVALVRARYAGVSSADSGHDAVVFVDDAVRIDVYPPSAVLKPGETRAIQATAHLAGGGVINVTNQVELLSLNALVADFLDPDAPNVLTALALGDATLDVGLPGGGARGSATISVSDTTTTTSTSTTTSTTLPGGSLGTLVIEPASQTVDFGEDAVFTAMLAAPDGSRQDVSARVTWKVTDASIASGAGGKLTTKDPGTTTITAVDPTTGAAATPASLTVGWSLAGITLHPRRVNRGVGDYERFEAVGHFAKGRDLGITKRLTYTSSAPAIAAVEATALWPSQVVAHAEGQATISACDPLSGICSSASGGDAAVLVAGGLQSIELQPNGVAQQFPGGSQQYTAIGHFDDGSTQDLTASVEWTSTSPSVALASNLDGSRGKVYALAPGFTLVQARDPETGIQSFGVPFYTLGPIQQIWLDVPDPFQVGGSAFFGATALHEGGGERNVSQEVTWGSRDPGLAVTPNEPAARNRVDGVGVGFARIFATDPATGVTSDDGQVLVYGALEALDLEWQGGGWPPSRVGLGGIRTYHARGRFEGGYYENFTSSGHPYTLVSSDPAVALVVDATTVRGVGAGTATITAVDDATGVTGSGQSLTVQGALERIVLEPAMKLRGVGERQTFTATGHYPPDDATANITQDLVYHSSDESVAIALNDPALNKSTILTVGPGTTVISATDPVTGVSSSDSGDDAVLEVIAGVPDQIVVSPPDAFRMVGGSEEFTAVAHYPDGTTINVTQQVEWSSSASSVAGAFLPNRRSLFRATGPGVATISATHPSGVSSSDSGHDAVMEVDAVQSLAIQPASRTLRVGQTEEFTVIATLARGGQRNVTQYAFYWRSPFFPSILEVGTNPDRRSLVTALAPGVVDVVASYRSRQVKARVTILPAGSPSGAFLAD